MAGAIVGMIFGFFIGSGYRLRKAGTMVIDMEDPKRDICRFVLKDDLFTISKEKAVIFTVQSLGKDDKRLQSFDD